MSDVKSHCSEPFARYDWFLIEKNDSLTIEAECVLHAGLTLPILEESADVLIKKTDGMKEEIKEVEGVCVVSQQARVAGPKKQNLNSF